jgi:fimbrial isopeptide formation D2 family protein
MFKKLISNLSFSPSLVGQLGFYVKRLRQEEVTRRAGLILTALALVVQGLIVFAPAQTQAAAGNNDIIFGGFTSKTDLLRIYDKGADSAGRRDIQQIYSRFGVTRNDIKNAALGRINSKDFSAGIYSTGRISYGSLKGADEQAVKIPGTSTTIYMRKLRAFDAGHQIDTGNGYAALIGKRSVDGKWFAIVLACGNVDFTTLAAAPKPTSTPPPTPTTTPVNPTPTPPSPTPTPLTAPQFVTQKTVSNLTTATINTTSTVASAGDRLEYTLSAKNTGSASGTYAMRDTISDVLEYADVVDNGGATMTASTGGSTTPDTMTWPATTVAPGGTIIERFDVQVKSDVPATPENISNPASFDCVMTNTFGQTTSVTVNCPAAKQIETVVSNLPSTGPTENLLVGGITFAVVVYFYARSRQLGREVRLIRRDFNQGTF